MKHPIILPVLFLLSVLTMQSHAQQAMEDVVYLNNGSILRGIIIEQVPNRSLKVQISGGSVFHVELGEVARMTREPMLAQQSVRRDPSSAQRAESRRDTTAREPYIQKKRGYFFQGQLLLEMLQGGVRVVNGYRIGRFGHIGVGLGIDLSGPSLTNAYDVAWNGGSAITSGVYLPIYLQYSGEILNRRVTPFYAVEAGYAAAISGRMHDYPMYDEFGYGYGHGPDRLRGGAMWGLGIGVRFKTRRRLNFSLLLNVNAKNVSYREHYYWYDGNLQAYMTETQRVRTTLVYPGLRFGMGF